MNIAEKKEVPLEILVATMRRNSLEFLDRMFQHNTISDFRILVVNQTTEDCLLESDSDHIRVINSFETGLSLSRNLAIRHAKGEICLIADDDVVYVKDFDRLILKSFKNNPEADLITFKTLTTENKPYSDYPNKKTPLGRFYKKVLSIEIAFKQRSLIENQLYFDESFGLGGVFEDGENRIFLRTAIHHDKLKAYFVPEFIVQHPPSSSSDLVYSDRYIFARSALNYKYYGFLAYFYSFKLLFTLVRKGLIKPKEIKAKWLVAKQGIKTYKSTFNA